MNKKISRLSLSSFPIDKSHDPASLTPGPNKPLFLSLLDSDAHKQRDLMASDPSLSKSPPQIQESFYQGLYMTAQVSDLEIITASPSSNLTIMVDGRVYGDYSHLRVSSVLSKDNRRLCFNFMTFVNY